MNIKNERLKAIEKLGMKPAFGMPKNNAVELQQRKDALDVKKANVIEQMRSGGLAPKK